MTVRCYLAASEIEGLGIYCRDDIRAGDVIWRHDMMMDVRIPIAKLADYPEHVREFVERYAYVDLRDDSMLVLESDEGRFMNHSLTPNTDFRGMNEGYALVDIPAGTEITCDYREFGDNLAMQPPRHAVQPAATAA